MADALNEPVLDSDTLEALRALGGDDDPGLFVEVIELYLEDAKTHVGNLRSALEAGDLRLLERTAHTLKSASANVGARGFSQVCSELEQSVRNARLDATPSLVSAAEVRFRAVEAALRAMQG